MKITLIGATRIWCIENFYLKYLQNIPDVSVNIISSSDFFKKKLGLFQKIDRRIRPSNNHLYQQFNTFLLEKLSTSDVDIIMVFKGMEIFPSTLKRLKKKYILANYNGDHPFLITSRGGGNKNVRDSIPLFDVHFSYSRRILGEIRKKYGVNAKWLPFAYEPIFSQEKGIDFFQTEKEILRVCFIGTPDVIRVQKIKYLLKKNLAVDVYGNDWDRFLKLSDYPNLKINSAVFEKEFWKTAAAYRVQLNIFRPHNTGSHNMRTFEMPATGAIMLAPNSEEHQLFFKDGEEAFFFNDEEDMVRQAKVILNLPLEKALDIRRKARLRSANEYTYEKRVNLLYSYLETFIKCD